MLPRDSFWFLAGALVAVAIMVTVRAWLRERPALGERPAGSPRTGVDGSPAENPTTVPATSSSSIPSFAVPIAAALALVGVALGIYFLLGSPDSIASSHAAAAPPPSHDQPAPNAGSMDDVTNKLATRLATQGGSDNDWQL